MTWQAVLGTEGEMGVNESRDGRALGKRSQRFAIGLPLRYRQKGTVEWLEGTTVNISASGLLFRCASVVEPKTAVEVALVLPVAIPGETAAEIVCQGTVIRNATLANGSKPPLVAATFQHYRIARERHKVKG
jgi:hypothetical protein